MKYQVTTTYTEALISTAVRKYWMRKYSRDAVLSVVFLSVALYFFFVKSYNDWATGLLLGVALIYTISVYAVFFVMRGRSLAMLRSMGGPRAEWLFADDIIVCESGAGKSELKWPVIKKLWRYSDVWLLFYASGAYSTLPVEALSPEAQNFIEQKIRAAGGEVA